MAVAPGCLQGLMIAHHSLYRVVTDLAGSLTLGLTR